MTDKLIELLNSLQGHRVVVIGDIVADQFIYGQAARVSREAPVLILEHEQDKIALGGAANAAHNVKALGGEPLLVGLLGNDAAGDQVIDYLRSRDISTDFIIRTDSRPTTTKLRIVASGLHTTYQQMLRVDRGSRDPIDVELEKELLATIDRAAGKGEVIVASDYGYGVFNESVITRIAAIGQSDWCKVLVDSRYRALEFKGAYLITPNETEAASALRMEIRNREDAIIAAERLLMAVNAYAVVVTRGKQGMYLLEKAEIGEHLPIYGTDEIADVTGAGDTVIATFALATAVGAGLAQAARLATVAAGLVVLKMGTATVTPEEIKAALEANPWRES